MDRKADNQIDFSIVVPIKDEVNLIPRTLPSYYAVNPSEVVICTDKPTPRNVRQIIQKVAVACGAPDVTRIVEVERDPDWNFHQAHVRRTGFKKAKQDRILTVDIDLVINRNVLKALQLLGKNNIGLVSCSKFYYPKSLLDLWRIGTLTFLRKIVHRILDPFMEITLFTGLYAVWKPYWLDSESEEKIKKHMNPKQFYRGEYVREVPADVNPTGEDTFLKDCILEKHRCIYLRDVGAIMLRDVYENVPYVQYMKGQYSRRRGRSLLVAIGRAFLRAEPHYLRGFLHARARKGRRVKSSTTLNIGCGSDTWGDIRIDINPNAIGATRIADAHDLSFLHNESIAEIRCQEVLEHVENPSQVLREMKRVLKDNGVIRLSVPNLYEWRRILWDIRNPKKLHSKLIKDHENKQSWDLHKQGWDSILFHVLCDQVGLEIKDVEYFSLGDRKKRQLWFFDPFLRVILPSALFHTHIRFTMTKSPRPA